jgi:hypothetical protein
VTVIVLYTITAITWAYYMYQIQPLALLRSFLALFRDQVRTAALLRSCGFCSKVVIGGAASRPTCCSFCG